MRSYTSNALIMISLAISGGCGGAGFSGNKSKTTNNNDDALGTAGEKVNLDREAGQQTVQGGTVQIAPPTEEEKVNIDKCSKAWGRTPPVAFDVVRKIKASVSVGSSGVTLSDQANTSGPVLTLLYAGVNVGGEPTWELLNPQGWYCVVVNVNVLTKLTVKLSKDAKLADSKVAVNVGSQVEGTTAAVGVNVGSEIKVIKQ